MPETEIIVDYTHGHINRSGRKDRRIVLAHHQHRLSFLKRSRVRWHTLAAELIEEDDDNHVEFVLGDMFYSFTVLSRPEGANK